MAINDTTKLVLDEQKGVQTDDTDNDVLLDATLSDALTALGVAGISPTDPATGFPQPASSPDPHLT